MAREESRVVRPGWPVEDSTRPLSAQLWRAASLEPQCRPSLERSRIQI
jgi:hypothetical protein